MKGKTWPWKPINGYADWDLDIDSLRLDAFLAYDWHESIEAINEGERLLALADESGHIYPRERALILIERLLAFYVSITDEQIDNYNAEIDGYEGSKTALRIRLDRTLFKNRSAMGIIDQASDEKSVPEK